MNLWHIPLMGDVMQKWVLRNLMLFQALKIFVAYFGYIEETELN